MQHSSNALCTSLHRQFVSHSSRLYLRLQTGQKGSRVLRTSAAVCIICSEHESSNMTNTKHGSKNSTICAAESYSYNCLLVAQDCTRQQQQHLKHSLDLLCIFENMEKPLLNLLCIVENMKKLLLPRWSGRSLGATLWQAKSHTLGSVLAYCCICS